jgi:signal peptidase II
MHPAPLSILVQAIISALLVVVALVIFLLRFARGRLWMGVALGIALADQTIKFVVKAYLHSGQQVPMPGNTAITYSKNFLLGFSSADTDLMAATLALVLALLVLYLRLTRFGYRMGLLAELACALIIGGCIGILVDRICWGFVIDWIDLGPRSQFLYNLADLAVIAAAVLLAAAIIQFSLKRARRMTDPDKVARKAVMAVRQRYGDIPPYALAMALGIRITHQAEPSPPLADLPIRSEYIIEPATIVLYDKPLRRLARLLSEQGSTLAKVNLEELHIAHEIFHHFDPGRDGLAEKAAHCFAAELLHLDISLKELDRLYVADHT